ncbi:MAG TPA: VCBS repeat-containing protein, partial [Candidatus Acidoferrum sp.]|nr:VCBS repeat-containing protein [Candidatus Acidoferrum sp.]
MPTTLADVDRDGATDIVVTNKASGEFGVLRNLGHGAFAPAVLYRAGGGLYGVTNTDGSATLTTLEATSGVSAGAFSRGDPPDLVAADPGSNTFSLLRGLGAGRFANPVTVPTASPARAIRVADLEGNGVPDMIVLGT